MNNSFFKNTFTRSIAELLISSLIFLIFTGFFLNSLELAYPMKSRYFNSSSKSDISINTISSSNFNPFSLIRNSIFFQYSDGEYEALAAFKTSISDSLSALAIIPTKVSSQFNITPSVNESPINKIRCELVFKSISLMLESLNPSEFV